MVDSKKNNDRWLGSQSRSATCLFLISKHLFLHWGVLCQKLRQVVRPRASDCCAGPYLISEDILWARPNAPGCDFLDDLDLDLLTTYFNIFIINSAYNTISPPPLIEDLFGCLLIFKWVVEEPWPFFGNQNILGHQNAHSTLHAVRCFAKPYSLAHELLRNPGNVSIRWPYVITIERSYDWSNLGNSPSNSPRSRVKIQIWPLRASFFPVYLKKSTGFIVEFELYSSQTLKHIFTGLGLVFGLQGGNIAVAAGIGIVVIELGPKLLQAHTWLP